MNTADRNNLTFIGFPPGVYGLSIIFDALHLQGIPMARAGMRSDMRSTPPRGTFGNAISRLRFNALPPLRPRYATRYMVVRVGYRW